MLQVVIGRLPSPDNHRRLVAKATPHSYLRRAQLGMHQLLWPSEWRRPIRSATGMALRRYRDTFGIVTEQELDAVIDFMGFRYGDIGHRETLLAERETTRWKQYGAKVIFLPQAFGPFTKPRLKRAMQRIAANSLLLCPRDEASEGYLRDIVSDQHTVMRAPDITIATQPSHKIGASMPWLGIIPNIWMVERTDKAIATRYFQFLGEMSKLAAAAGLIPKIVLHAPVQDMRLLARLREVVTTDCEVIIGSDGMQMKALIAKCSLVVGARYHGLVAAMSQGVPTLGTSWSHKYNGLFNDFECPDMLVRPDISRDECKRVFKRMLTDAPAIRSRLLASTERLTGQVECMWDRVRDCLGLSNEDSAANSVKEVFRHSTA